MNILFVHQNFPGQYRHIIKALSLQGQHCIVGLGIEPLSEGIPANVQYLRYPIDRCNTPHIHDWVIETETKVIRGEACGRAAHQLKQNGFIPDLICVHPGWGEALFLKDVWPNTPILSYQEFYYNPIGFDYDYDPAMQGELHWEQFARLRMKNANLLLSLQASDWSVTPTEFQRSSFPAIFQPRISCIHDGIDTSLAAPRAESGQVILNKTLKLVKGQPIVTFVNRNIEPYRGCHTFIRSIPLIHEYAPKAKIIIVGKEEGVSYGKPAPSGTWKDLLLSEIKGQYNPENVHFVGSLSYPDFLALLRITACHVYLTYPFVLSWSLLEAMSSQAPIVASSTAPVREVLTDGETGLLVNFFSPQQLAEAVARILDDKNLADEMGNAARAKVVRDYDIKVCVPLQLSLMDLVSKLKLN